MSENDAQSVVRLREARHKLKLEIAKEVVGQEKVIDSLLVALLCRGHALMIGVPGLGKTLMARTLARALDMDYRRIQFTPDLMPSDITGTDITGTDIIVEDPESNRRRLEFHQGPLFTNFLFADEINRAPPKTQAALLQAMQAMQAMQVSVGRQTYPLAPPFFVVATQNPVDQEGTYPLPEAQLDRFMLNIRVTYPTPKEEADIVKNTTANTQVDLMPRRGLVVLISDLYYESAELFAALDHFSHFGHDVLLFQVLSPLERHMPIDGAVKLVDAETGTVLETLAHEMRDSFEIAVERWIDEIHTGCQARNVEHVCITTDVPLEVALVNYKCVSRWTMHSATIIRDGSL